MPAPLKAHPLFQDYVRYETRRQFFHRGASFMGAAALGLLAPQLLEAGGQKIAGAQTQLKSLGPHFPPKARRVIYLHMVGGPPQMDLFDYKPAMREWYDK